MGYDDGFTRTRGVRAACTRAGAGVTAAAAFVALGMLAGAPAMAATGGATVTTPAQVIAAFNDATAAGGTITLGNDITVTGTALELAAGDALTMNLAGHVLTVTGPAGTGTNQYDEHIGGNGGSALTVFGTLTVQDGTLNATGGQGRGTDFADQIYSAGVGGEGIYIGASSVPSGTLSTAGVTVRATGGAGGTGQNGIDYTGTNPEDGTSFGGSGGQGGIGLSAGSAQLMMRNGSLVATGGAGGDGGNGADNHASKNPAQDDAGGNGGDGGDGLVAFASNAGGALGFADMTPTFTAGDGGNGGNGGNGGAGGNGGNAGNAGAGFMVPGDTQPVAPVTFDGAACQAPTHTFTAYTTTVGQAEQIMNVLLPGWPSAPGMAQSGWFTQKTGGDKADPDASTMGQTLYAQCTPLPTVVPVAPTVTQAVCTTSGGTTGPTVTAAQTDHVAYTVDEHNVAPGKTAAVTARITDQGFRWGTLPAGWTVNPQDGAASYLVTLTSPHCTVPTPAPTPTAVAAAGPSVHTGGTVAQASDTATTVAPWLAAGALGVAALGGVFVYRRRTHRE